MFEGYGNIAGVRMGVAAADYRYAHVYFGAGEVPILNGTPQYMADVNATEEEKAEVERAVNSAVSQFIPGDSPLYVRYAKERRRSEAGGGGRDEFEKGFAVGYRQGFVDGQKQQ
ncbi:hypothetical protein H4R20_000391 [Coemansia guatemalensis]|uniref:Uncharacterized protein n=1 Tax=Coemansia guatemalensis TaxID=2761395 RepID=A0A9W8HZA4_9FUNG|nr:hypothetical protein H4R20_000391 [Coemansia guatemalensis]